MQRKTYNLKLNLIDVINIKGFSTEEAILYFLNSEIGFFHSVIDTEMAIYSQYFHAYLCYKLRDMFMAYWIKRLVHSRTALKSRCKFFLGPTSLNFPQSCLEVLLPESSFLSINVTFHQIVLLLITLRAFWRWGWRWMPR